MCVEWHSFIFKHGTKDSAAVWNKWQKVVIGHPLVWFSRFFDNYQFAPERLADTFYGAWETNPDHDRSDFRFSISEFFHQVFNSMSGKRPVFCDDNRFPLCNTGNPGYLFAKKWRTWPGPETDDVAIKINDAVYFYLEEIATELRRAGIPSEIYLGTETTLKGQLAYAVKQGAPFVIIVGSVEKEQGIVKLKDMTAREQSDVPRSDIVRVLSEKQN